MKKLACAFLAFAFVLDLAVYMALSRVSVSTNAFYTLDDKSDALSVDSRVYTYLEMEKLLYKFIEKYFIGKNGEVYTRVQSPGGDMSTLSESIGLLMAYGVLTDKKDLFDREFAFLKNHLLVENSFIKWRTGGLPKATCNAAIDDLRIIRALLDAHERWGGRDYLRTADRLQKSFYENQAKNGVLTELYDWAAGEGKNSIPLCYIDLYTLYRMTGLDERWREISDNGLRIIKGGSLDKTSPFFYKYYDIQRDSYSKDEEYAKSREICITYAAYTALHMAEANEDTECFKSWLKKEMDNGRLYAWYHPDTLKPSRDAESTAVYALSAMYAQKAGERELCHRLLDKMLQFMVTDPDSRYYGGFGSQQTGEFYSFDNLTALLALAEAAGQ
ncbi:MAG: glycosyl hydrolase family 8 [Clostridiales bacterium]|jgi:endo-1,4-beta-D-glucanase Y|nr:glycosyl hydrolase family 8 [Eubacteriales bacterium]MDH7567554.1 glycosyl hydrolase family 8 [Clostridiales bacterium]